MGSAVHLAAVIFGSLGVACATTVDVAFDERADFSRYRTWDWLPRAARTIEAPPSETLALDVQLARACGDPRTRRTSSSATTSGSSANR